MKNITLALALSAVLSAGTTVLAQSAAPPPPPDYTVFVDPPTGFVFVKLPQGWKFAGRIEPKDVAALPGWVVTALLPRDADAATAQVPAAAPAR